MGNQTVSLTTEWLLLFTRSLQIRCSRTTGGALRELAAEVPSATAHSALDKALDSTLNAVPPGHRKVCS